MNPDSSTCCYNVKAHVKPYIVIAFTILIIAIPIITTLIISIISFINFNIIIIIIITINLVNDTAVIV